MGTVALASSANFCLHSQVSLDNTCENPGGFMNNVGFLQALMSEANMVGYEQLTNSVANSKRQPATTNAPPTVEIKIEKPNCEAETATATTKADLCDAGSASTELDDYVEVDITQTARQSWVITKADFRDLCDSPNERFARELRRRARLIREAVNSQLLTLAHATFGLYPSNGLSSTGATTKNAPLINPDGHINPAVLAVIKREFRQMGCQGAPMVVGGEALALKNDVRLLGGIGANGIQANPDFRILNDFYDMQIDTIYQGLETDTSSHAISWSPGAMQLLEWFQWTGDFAEAKEDYARTVINIDGMDFDYSVNYDKCTSAWTVHLQKCYDLYTLPDALYTPCYTFNHKLHWTIDCGATACTDFD